MVKKKNEEKKLKTGERGLLLIKSFEGLYLKTYICPAGVPTIGYGTTRINGKPVPLDLVITEAQATEYLVNDLKSVEDVILSSVKVPLNQNQFDALVSFVYNVGSGNFRASTLLRLLNAGDYKAAAGQFIRWNKAGGKVLSGLTRRREAETKLFLLEEI